MADIKRKPRTQSSLTIYKTSARDLTVVRGKTGIIYPFYRSTGANSFYRDTWFPWMGYFDRNPNLEKELYMVKPDKLALSSQALSLIEEVLDENTPIFIARISNDEALAISCAIGGGVWSIYPELCRAIQACEVIRPYLPYIINSQLIRIKVKHSKEPLSYFEGIQYRGFVSSAHAALAMLMENLTRDESCKLLDGAKFSIQDKKEFPTSAELKIIPKPCGPIQQLTHWGVFKEVKTREPSLTENPRMLAEY